MSKQTMFLNFFYFKVMLFKIINLKFSDKYTKTFYYHSFSLKKKL